MRKVILVNDSRFECMIMKDILGTMGYEVAISDEYKAIEQVENFKPDIAIINLTMRQISGDQLITIIKLQNPKIYCLLSSANKLSLNEFRFKKIDDVITTPIDRAGFETVFNRMRQKVGTAIEEKVNLIKADVCPACGNNIGDKKYAFCHFCGAKL